MVATHLANQNYRVSHTKPDFHSYNYDFLVKSQQNNFDFCDISRKVLEFHCNSVSDTVFTLSYFPNFDTSDSLLFGRGWWPFLALPVIVFYFAHLHKISLLVLQLWVKIRVRIYVRYPVSFFKQADCGHGFLFFSFFLSCDVLKPFTILIIISYTL